MKHARLGPSNKRWPSCPGSVDAEQDYPDISGDAAIDGTGSHILLEMCLVTATSAANYLDQTIGIGHDDKPNGWVVHQDRIDRVQICLDYVYRRYQELTAEYPGAEITISSETKYDPGGAFGRDDWWGTCDITLKAMMDSKCLFIEAIDYKDGRMYVPEKNNTQLISYLFGAMRPYVCSGPDLVRPLHPEKVKDCRMTIVQPKTDRPIRYDDDTTPYGVVADAIELSRAAAVTDDPNAPRISGQQCQWCKHKPNCSAAMEKSLETVAEFVGGEYGDLFKPLMDLAAMVPDMTPEQLSSVFDAAPGVIAFFDQIKTRIEADLDQGLLVPGYAMLPSRSGKAWKNEALTVKLLKGLKLKKADYYPENLISPAAARSFSDWNEKQLERIDNAIEVKPGKPSLKKAVKQEPVSAEEMFPETPALVTSFM